MFHWIMSSPVGLDADTVDFAGGSALLNPGTDLDFYKARIFALHDKLTDFICAHIQYWRKLGGYVFGALDNSRLGKNGSDSIACRQHPAPAIKNHTALRFLRNPPLKLFCRNADIMVVLEKLEIKAPPRQ